MVLWAVSAGFATTVLMFTILRWFAISDWMRAATADIQSATSSVQTMKEQIAEMINAKKEILVSVKTYNETITGTCTTLTARVERLSECVAELRRSAQSLNGSPLEDQVSIWSGITCEFNSLNPTLDKEVSITTLAGGQHYKIAADQERMNMNFIKRLQQRMRLSYIVYIPKDLSLGTHPVEVLLKLVHVLRYCRKQARAMNTTLKANIRIFLIDEPRPGSAVFFGYRKIDGRKEKYILEYFRSLDLNNTPTGNRLVIAHTNENEIRSLFDHLDREARKAVEIDVGTVERIINPLLPETDGGIAKIVSRDEWRNVVNELYSAGIGTTEEKDAEGIAVHKRSPSVSVARSVPPDLTLLHSSNVSDAPLKPNTKPSDVNGNRAASGGPIGG
jgi:hypothetical protein